MLLNSGTLMPGTKVLVTTDNWFYGPDGQQYQGVYGTVIGVFTDSQTLGVKTNARPTNWYAQIGTCVVAGCQIHYAVLAGEPPPPKTKRWTMVEGIAVETEAPSAIFNADEHPTPLELLRSNQRPATGEKP